MQSMLRSHMKALIKRRENVIRKALEKNLAHLMQQYDQ